MKNRDNPEWYRKNLRIAVLAWKSKLNYKKILSTWKEYYFNCEQVSHVAWNSFGNEKEMESAVNHEKAYIREAHKNGLKIIYYFNVHILSLDYAGKHPDLAARNRAGEMINMYNPGFAANCLTKPYKDWACYRIKYLAERLDIDGLFLDGPMAMEDGCFCAECRKLFKEIFGYAPDSIAVSEAEHRKNLNEYNLALVNDFLDGARKTLKQIKPDALFYINSQALNSGKRAGRDNRIQIKYQDLLGAEGGFVYYDIPGTVPLWKSGAASKLLQSQSGGKPTVIFMAGDHKNWHRYFLTPAETKLYYLGAVANGSNIWYGPHTDMPYANKSTAEVKKINSFIARHEEYYSNTKSCADTALLCSLLNDEKYRTSVPGSDFNAVRAKETKGMFGNFMHSFNGYYEILLRSQLPFDVIDDNSLFEGISRYKAIVLPNCGCFSGKMAGSLKEYVREGGNLVCQFDTSLFNENGDRLDEFQLSDLFGISFPGNFHQYFTASYFSFMEGSGKYFKDISQNLLPAPQYVAEVKPSTAEVLAKFHNPMRGQYMRLEKPLYPAILRNKFGKGAVYYFAGTFGELYWDYRIHDYRKIFSAIINGSAGRKIILKNNPDSVEVILREKDKKTLLLHLINFSNDGGRPIESIIPLNNIEVNLKNFGRIKSIKNLYSPKKITRKSSNSFIIPFIDTYELVVIELA